MVGVFVRVFTINVNVIDETTKAGRLLTACYIGLLSISSRFDCSGVGIILVDVVNLLLLFFYDSRSHDPFYQSDNYSPIQRYGEIAGNHPILAVVHSSSFLITIRNVNFESRRIQGTVYIKRTVRWNVYGHKRRIEERKATVGFAVDLDLQPNEEIDVCQGVTSLNGLFSDHS